MNAYIKAISYYLPEQEFNNEDLAKQFPEWSAKKVALKVGIQKRHITRNDECASDLAVCASKKLFEENNIAKSDIDFVLLCTQSPDYFLPTTACLVQDRLGLRTNIGALDFNLGCSGYVYGLSLAKGLIMGGIAKNILLITAETYTKYLHPKDKANRTIFGDAATATLVSTDGFASIEEFSLGTDGRGANNLIIKSGGLRNPNKVGDLSFDEFNNPKSSDYLFMNGPEIFNFTLDTLPQLYSDVLKKNHLDAKELDLVIFHQANKYILNFLRDALDIEEDKFYLYLSEVGNTVSSTIPIALHESKKENKAKGNILLAGFGVGYSWGACILKIK